jgi:hypothetical protein
MEAQPSKTYTLAGSAAWQRSQLTNPTYRHMNFTSHERKFITEAFDPEDEEEGFTGTTVEYVEPEGSDCHWSQISSDHEDDPEMTDTEDAVPGQPKMNRKGKFKKMAQKLYPRKMVGGAKVMGGAIRHPMMTGRKVNNFVRRKNKNSTQNASDLGASDTFHCTTDNLPPLTRSATTSEWDMRPTGEKQGIVLLRHISCIGNAQRRGILRRRNSCPFERVSTQGPPFRGEMNMEIEIDIDIEHRNFRPTASARPVPASPGDAPSERAPVPSRISLNYRADCSCEGSSISRTTR